MSSAMAPGVSYCFDLFFGHGVTLRTNKQNEKPAEKKTTNVRRVVVFARQRKRRSGYRAAAAKVRSRFAGNETGGCLRRMKRDENLPEFASTGGRRRYRVRSAYATSSDLIISSAVVAVVPRVFRDSRRKFGDGSSIGRCFRFARTLSIIRRPRLINLTRDSRKSRRRVRTRERGPFFTPENRVGHEIRHTRLHRASFAAAKRGRVLA